MITVLILSGVACTLQPQRLQALASLNDWTSTMSSSRFWRSSQSWCQVSPLVCLRRVTQQERFALQSSLGPWSRTLSGVPGGFQFLCHILRFLTLYSVLLVYTLLWSIATLYISNQRLFISEDEIPPQNKISYLSNWLKQWFYSIFDSVQYITSREKIYE